MLIKEGDKHELLYCYAGKINGEFRIFRDDGLRVIQSKSPRSAETTLKALRNLFNKWGFKIGVEAGQIETDFLDIEVNLITETYFPFKKPSSSIFLC